MRKYLVYMCIFAIHFLGCRESNSSNDEEVVIKSISSEFRAGYFYFTDGNARKIYNNGTIDLEVENNFWWRDQGAFWGNINFIWANGKTAALRSPSNVKIATLSGGVKGFLPLKSESKKKSKSDYIDEIEVYLGIGLAAAVIWTNDQMQVLFRETTRFSPGVVGKFGFLVHSRENFIFDPFFDYYFQPTTNREENYVDVGGFKTGIGLGYLF